MVLNYIWIAFFLIAFVIATFRLVFLGDTEVFPEIINSTFSSSKTAFEISLGLTGVLSLWLGIMKIGEKGGVIDLFARMLSPLFTKLFPGIPKGHPVTGISILAHHSTDSYVIKCFLKVIHLLLNTCSNNNAHISYGCEQRLGIFNHHV